MNVGDDFPSREGALLSVGPVTVISHAPITVLNTNAAQQNTHIEYAHMVTTMYERMTIYVNKVNSCWHGDLGYVDKMTCDDKVI